MGSKLLHLERWRYLLIYNIPDTAYQLMFEEQERTPRGLRVAELHISGGDVMGEHLSLAIVGCLEYEGRLR